MLSSTTSSTSTMATAATLITSSRTPSRRSSRSTAPSSQSFGTRARDKGVEWAITLDISPEDLIELIRDAASGHLEESPVAQEWDAENFLGAAANLSRRESEVLQLVVLGRSNQEIADTMFVSVNSVKTYIRSAYRKINVPTRAQAIVWAIHHGFLTERLDHDADTI